MLDPPVSNRPEAGIRNVRYRRNLRTETEDNIKSLQERKKELEDQLKGLDQKISLKSENIKSLEDKKEDYERILISDEESITNKIESKLVQLKMEKPELFYITDAEQIAKLGVAIVKWLLN